MNKRIQKIIDNSQAVIFYWQAKANWPVEYVSRNVAIFGYRDKDFISGRIQYANIIHPEDAPRVAREVETYTHNKQDDFRQVYRLIDSSGQSRWIDDRTVIERDAEGKPAYYLGTIIDITKQRAAEQQSLLLENLVNQSTDEIYVFGRDDLKFTYVNHAVIEQLNLGLSELLSLTPLDIKTDMEPNVFKALLAPLTTVIQPSESVSFETTHHRKDGSIYPVEVKVQLLEVDDKLQYVAVVRDITERKALAAQRDNDYRFAQEVIDGVADSLMVINADYSLSLMNHAAQKMIDSQYVKDPQHPKCYEVSHQRSMPCDGADHPCPLKIVFETQKSMSVIHNHGHHGHDHFVELMAKPLMNEAGQVYAIVESAHDVTDLIKAQESLRAQAEAMAHQASHDALTGLPNRRLFDDRLDQSILRANRLHSLMAVVFIDVDKFKQINDAFGHLTGDDVLIEVATRLQGCLRSSDTVARLGGDEFTVIIEAVQDLAEFEGVCQKIMAAFEVPIDTKHSGIIPISVSMGASIYPQDALERKPLIKKADLALYDVKVKGRNDFRFFHQLLNCQ